MRQVDLRVSDVEAGYTYFGQFIDHDLTRDFSPLENASSDAQTIANFSHAFPGLESGLWWGPNLSPFLYHEERRSRLRKVLHWQDERRIPLI
jgi:hypothetical protein